MRLMCMMVRALQLKSEILDLMANLHHLSLFDLIPPTTWSLYFNQQLDHGLLVMAGEQG